MSTAMLSFRQRFFTELDLPARWGRIRRQSWLTFPFALLTAFAVWLVLFLFLYDIYVTSFGTGSYFDYALVAPFADVVKSTWGLIGRRDTAGIFILALVLAAPLMFTVLVLWMLKGGRAFSRHILYLLHIRSTRRLVGIVIMGQFLSVSAVVVYSVVFYVVATEFEKRTDLAKLYFEKPLAMATTPFGLIDPSGAVVKAPGKIRRAGVLAFLAAIAGIGFPVGLAIQKRGRMVYGGARLGTLTDAADFGLRKKRGVVLGTRQGLLLVDDSDKHVLVIGSPGQGKSRSLVIPSMMRFGGSMFVLDFGGELFKDMAGWLSADGYSVHVIAPGKNETDGFNPFDFISSDPIQRITDLQKLSLMIMPERVRSDASDFWEESARILLTALMAFIIECPDTRKTLGELQRILGSMPDEREAITQLMEKYEHTLSDATRMQLDKFRGRHDKLGEGIAAEIGAKIDVLQNRNLEAMLSATTIPLKDIRNRKMAIFLDVDLQSVRIFERFISLLIETTMDIFIKQGPLRDNQHDVMVMLDEFGNAGRLDTILTQAPLMRKYGIRFVSILQDSAQLERLYEKTGREIIAGSSTIKLYMNFQNPRDAQYISSIAGKTTEWLPTSSYTYRHGRRDRQASMMPVQKDLLSVSDLMMLKPEESILHVAGAPIFKVLKVEGSDDLRFGAYTKCKNPPRPKMEIIETDGIDEGARFNKDGSTIYVSTLDGLRQRLGLNPLREAGVDLAAALIGDGEGRDRKDNQPDKEMKTDLVDMKALRGEAWEGVREKTLNEKYFERAENVVVVDNTMVGSPIITAEELREGFGIGNHDHWELPDGLLDGTIQTDNADPLEINAGIMALVNAARQSIKTEPKEAFEELEMAVSDPLQEEDWPRQKSE
ncbi:type IV secretory system conjugative DNA transfer family protein [Phyllobacterium sophorae]|nr:type IV secretory system conjugative DNA transfer family protein [Phyllobacterium sophorae]